MTGRDLRGHGVLCAAIVRRWAERGLRRAIICPGSRSTPMALALHRSADIDSRVVIDERSAGFIALGMALTSRRPVVVLTTSGTGAVELHPAIVEADLAGVPLLCLTADRPAELQGVGAPQTIDQVRLFGTAVRGFFAVDTDSDPERGDDVWSVTADAIWDRACGAAGGPGPVQVNLAFREPLVVDGVDTAASASREPKLVDPLRVDPLRVEAPVLSVGAGLDPIDAGRLRQVLTIERGLVVCGDQTVTGEADAVALKRFLDHTGWVAAADPLSGASTDSSIRHLDGIVRAAPPEWEPDVVVRIGGLPASRVVREALDVCGAAHVGVRRGLAPPDPGRTLDVSIRGDTATVLDAWIAGTAPIARPDGWRAKWRRWDDAARRAIDSVLADCWCEPHVVREVVRSVPPGTPVVVSSSMPIRDLEWFGLDGRRRRVLSNRGANGIDGVVSTAVGAAIDAGSAVAVVGDVAAVHDIGGLASAAMLQRAALARSGSHGADLASIGGGLRLLVVVVDNGGGGIFSFLPQGELLSADEFETLFGTPHGIDVAAVASSLGLDSGRVASAGELSETLAHWFASEPKATSPRVVVADMSPVSGSGADARSGRTGGDAGARSVNVEMHRILNDAIATAIAAVAAVD